MQTADNFFPQLFSHRPLVIVYDNVLTADECAHFVSLAKPQLERATVSLDGGPGVSDARSNSVAWVDANADEITRTVAQRIAKLVQMPLENAESFQVVYYNVSQEYQAHKDAYELDTEKGQRCCELGGQRMITTLIYLSEVEAGGGTYFPKIDLRVAPQVGKLLEFHNCVAGTTEPDPLSLHAGEPVISGEKWAMNLWFHKESRQKKFSDLGVRPSGHKSYHLNRGGVVAEVLSELGWREADETEHADFAMWDTYNSEARAADKNLFFRKDTYCIADRKQLWVNLVQADLQHLMPKTWLTLDEFLPDTDGNGRNYLKTISSTISTGVFCFDSKDALAEKVAELNTPWYVIQKSVEPPHLYQNRKYTFRTFVLCRGNGAVYIFKESSIRLFTRPYDPQSLAKDVQICDPYGPQVSTDEFPDYEKIYPQIREMITGLFGAVKHKLYVNSEDEDYHLFGVDIACTRDLNPLLLEVNGWPDFSYTDQLRQMSSDRWLKRRLIIDTLALLFAELNYGDGIGNYSGRFERVL